MEVLFVESADLKLLICYILASLGEPMAGDDLCNLLSADGLAGYFDLYDSLNDLCREGLLSPVSEGYAVTPLGEQTASSFGRRLPAATCNRAVESCLRLLSNRRRHSETPCSVTPLPNGGFSVTLSVRDGSDSLLDVTLRVGDRLQADALVRRFENDPMLAYTGIIALLTGDLDSVGGQLLSSPQDKS